MGSLVKLSHHLAAASHGELTCLATLAALFLPLHRPALALPLQPLINLAIDPILSLITLREIRNNKDREMSRRNGKSPKVDLKLNVTRPRVSMTVHSPRRSATMSPTSPPSSCISSDMSQDDLTQLSYYSSSPEAQTKSMVLAGCQRCLMYVMLSEDDPKCPKCQNTVLLDFMQQGSHAGSTSTSTNKTKKNR